MNLIFNIIYLNQFNLIFNIIYLNQFNLIFNIIYLSQFNIIYLNAIMISLLLKILEWLRNQITRYINICTTNTIVYNNNIKIK